VVCAELDPFLCFDRPVLLARGEEKRRRRKEKRRGEERREEGEEM
jgi:hypothetical protein